MLRLRSATKSVIERSDALSLSKCRNNQKFNHSNIEKPKIWALSFGKSFVLLYVLGFVLICFAVSSFPLMAYRHLIRRIYFFLLREFILTHALHRRTACCSCTLNVSCFRKSLVVHAHRARPRLPSCKGLRSKECPRRRMKWRYATAGQQETAKQTTPNAQTKMAFRHCRTTKDREANNIQCANQNGVPPHPNNKRFTPLQTARHGSPC